MLLSSEEFFLIKSVFSQYLLKDQINDEFNSIKALTGDASSRKYFRVFTSKKTYIACIDCGIPDSIEDYSFYKINLYLKEMGISVPEIFFLSVEKKILILQDLGDQSLQIFNGNLSFAEQEVFVYKKCFDLMFNWLQLEKNKSISPFGNLQFDKNKLMSELEMTNDHFIKMLVVDKKKHDICNLLNNYFSQITNKIVDMPYVFTHRDFHSRNIMVNGKLGFEQLYIIDFQDARWGPLVYDLVSILEDSYYSLSIANKETLLDYYWNMIGVKYYSNYKQFMNDYNLVAIQRIYKVIGSFCFLTNSKRTRNYERYVGQNVERLKQILYFYPEYTELRKIILGIYYAS